MPGARDALLRRADLRRDGPGDGHVGRDRRPRPAVREGLARARAGGMTVTARERLQRLEALFHAAVALPPSERDAFLAAECTGDDALRIEVQALLAADAHETPHDVSGSIGRIAQAVSVEQGAAPARRIG